MLQEVKRIQGWTVLALDGEIGRVYELLLDDEHWAVRYIVVETGIWLLQRIVLISPLAFTAIDGESRSISVNLTQEKVKNSPRFASDHPIARPWEASFFDYYTWPYYWDASDSNRPQGDDAKDYTVAGMNRPTAFIDDYQWV
jgi:hypothetical protein